MWTTVGEHERIKSAVHGTMLAMALLSAGYNWLAYWRRGQSHLLKNALLYSCLVGLEIRHTACHLRLVEGEAGRNDATKRPSS